MGVERWSKAVEGIAKELAGCHRTQQAPVMVRLKEARHRLDQHRQEAAATQKQLPRLVAAAAQVGQREQAACQAALVAEQRLVAVAERRAQLQQELDVAMARHEAAAVAAVAASQEASAAGQQQRLLAAQQQAAAVQRCQAAQQVMHKQQEAVQLQAQVQRLQRLQQQHQDSVTAALATAPLQRRPKRRLQAVQDQEQVGAALPSPTAVQQRRPPPAGAAAALGGLGGARYGLPVPAAMEAGAAADGPEAVPLTLALCVQPSVWSCDSSELGSPDADTPPPPPLTVDEAAARFYSHLLLHRALHVMRQEAATMRSAVLAVTNSWQRRQLAAVVHAWQIHAADTADWLASASAAVRGRGLLRHWRAAAAERCWQHQAEAAANGFARRQLLACSVKAWRQHLQHEGWRDRTHEAVVLLRMRNMLRGWCAWARQRQQKAVRQRAALAMYYSRLLVAALRQWHRVQHGKALLQRVFSTAAELWQDEVGARLHQRNYERVTACWHAWQLAVLGGQEEWRQAMLAYAADAFREKQLQTAGMAAFQQVAADARERQRLVRLQAHMFAEWQRLATTSARHWKYEAAREHRWSRLLLDALAAWRSATEATTELLAHFWLCWQVQAPLRRVLLAWKAAAAAHHKQRVLCSVAAVHRERRLQQQVLAALAASQTASRSSSNFHFASRQQCAAAAASRQQVPVVAAAPRAALSQQQASSRQCVGGSAGVTIIISRGHKQLGPSGAMQDAVGSAVSDWRAAADYWRQRHQSYCEQQQQSPLAMPAFIAAGRQQQQHMHPLTAATLAELRQQA